MGISDDTRRGLINTIGASYRTPPGVRHRLLRLYGVTLGDSAVVRAGFYLDNRNVTIGDETFVNSACHFDGQSAISIGARCDIGMGVLFCTSTHDAGGPERRAGTPTSAPITIGDGSWIGARVTLLAGVNVAPGCVIAAGAVVARDTEPHGLYGGVPAVRLRDLSPSPAAHRTTGRRLRASSAAASLR
ncbi:MAG: acyltransferase [Solirubrobacteraceae bacterium]